MIFSLSNFKKFSLKNLKAWKTNWGYWVENNYIHSGVKEFLKEQLSIILNDKTKINLLDVGCGSGWVAKEYSSIYNTYLGVDFNEDLISFLNKKNNLKNTNYIYQDITVNFQLDKKYDVIISNFILLELENINSFFEVIKTKQVKGSYLLIFGLNSIYEIYRDSVEKNNFSENLELYRSQESSNFVIEKMMEFNNNANKNTYFRILHSMSRIINIAIKHNYTVDFIDDEVNKKSENINAPIYYFLKLKYNG